MDYGKLLSTRLLNSPRLDSNLFVDARQRRVGITLSHCTASSKHNILDSTAASNTQLTTNKSLIMVFPLPIPLKAKLTPFPEHTLQHRPQTIHLFKTRPLNPHLPNSTPHALPSRPNLCILNLLFPHIRLLFRPRQNRAQPLQKRKSPRTHHHLPIRTTILPRPIQRTKTPKRRPNHRCTKTRTLRPKTAPHIHARQSLFQRQRQRVDILAMGAEPNKWRSEWTNGHGQRRIRTRKPRPARTELLREHTHSTR